jgi:aspartate carbamoyltransferase
MAARSELKPLWRGASVVAVSQFKREDVELVLRTAEELAAKTEAAGGKVDLLRGKLLANVFYEASTRTASSFHAAMLRMGGDVVHVASSTSSSTKGETLQDTLRCLECYTDVVVLRHPEAGSALVGARCLQIPLLNAGDGPNEHPTQALLDIFTVHRELGRLTGITVTMVGDLKYGRTVHSLVRG